jgi:subtilase family serine protease
MKPARKGLTVVVTGAAVALSAVAANAGPASGSTGAAPRTTSVAHSCSQTPAPGHATCFALRRTDAAALSPRTAAAAAPPGYGPADLRSAYKLSSASRGSGQRVYVIDAFNDPTAESDLAVYRNRFGLPPCTTANGCFSKVNQSGARSPLPVTDLGWAQEMSVDLDMVSAICPHCGITLMEAKNSQYANLLTAAGTATSLGGKIVSMSFGGTQPWNETTLDANLAAAGVVYTASTGDSGFGVQYPAASNRVVAVGGTSLKPAANSRGWSESAWRGAGSGCSAHQPKPSWQNGIGTCSRRAVADVSAVANPRTGVAIYLTTGGSGWDVFGGTSVAAPIVAASYALAGKPAASTKPASLPYAHRSSLFDVKSGSNASCGTNLCTAGPGWDGPTGLGTPNGLGAFGGAA